MFDREISTRKHALNREQNEVCDSPWRNFCHLVLDQFLRNPLSPSQTSLLFPPRLKFFTVRALKHRHRFSREVADASPLEIFKVKLGRRALSNLI